MKKITNEKITLRKLTKFILSIDNALIIPHMNPDPDCLGSALGLKEIFNQLGKTAYIMCGSRVSDRMCGFFEIDPFLDAEIVEKCGFIPEKIICVDTAAPHLIGSFEEKYYDADPLKNKIDLIIDHHYTNSSFGKLNYIDEKAAATGEIIGDIARHMKVTPTQRIATALYCAIMSDSGSLRYSCTTAKTVRMCADFMETGFDFARINRLLFYDKSLTQIKIERLAYNKLKFYADGKISSVIITAEDKSREGLADDDITGISDIPKIVSGVEVGFAAKETNDNDGRIIFKVSLRSNEYVNVAKIAEKFGGGGHIRAAGCKIVGDAEYVERTLIESIKSALEDV